MKFRKGSSLTFHPASHENPSDPAVVRKILFSQKDFVGGGTIQMILWARLQTGRSFALHYHEDMEEVFILIRGEVEVTSERTTCLMKQGDAILIPVGAKHTMKNTSPYDAEYIVVGNSLGNAGRTIVV